MHHGRRRATAIVVGLTSAVVLLVPSLTAQQKSKPQEAPQVPRAVFRGGTEYVSVDVVVTDARDQPVTDLTAADFEIREKGQRQTIRDFEHVSVPVAQRVVDLKATPAPRPDVATNTPASHTSRAWVLLIDSGAVLPGDLVKLKRIMTEFLQTLSADDRVAVVHTGRSDLSQDFTSDFGLLARAVNNTKATFGFGKDARASRLSIDNVMTALAAVPETRRILVYVSSGFEVCDPMELFCVGLDYTNPHAPFSKFTPLGVQDLFDRSKAADVPIYTIDPRGLVAPDLNLGAHMEDQTPQARYAKDGASKQEQDFLRSLPEQTGGLFFTNINDLVPAVDTIMADNSSYYVLGYSPSPYLADSRFHDIEVRVVTRPGLRVRARRGYVASPPASAPDPHQRLLDAIGEPQAHSDLGLRAFVAPVAAAKNGATAIVTLDVAYLSAPSRTDDDLQIAFVAIDSDGGIKKSEPRAFHVALGNRSGDALTLSLDDVLDLPKGKWTLRIGVSSRVQNTTGTVHVPVEIPEFSTNRAASSPLVLGLTAGSTEVIGRPDAIAQLVPFQPTTRRVFAADQQVRVFARVFPQKPAATVTAELRVLRDSKSVRTIPVRVTSSPSGGNARDCLAILDLTDLATGNYALQLTAKASQGSVTSPQPVGIVVK